MFALGLVLLKKSGVPLFMFTEKAIISDISSAYLMEKSFSDAKRKVESIVLLETEHSP